MNLFLPESFMQKIFTFVYCVGDIQKVRSLKIPEFYPLPSPLVCPCSFSSPPLLPEGTFVLARTHPSPPQFLYLWNLEKKS